MGQTCSICGSQEESQQATAFSEVSSSDAPDSQLTQPSSLSHVQPPPNVSPPLDFNNHPHPLPHGHAHPHEPASNRGEFDLMEENERQRRLTQFRLEQVELARREAIVTAASQSMVPLGSQGSVSMEAHRMIIQHLSHNRGGGINTYYDPVYAAAAAQDILRSAALTGGLVFCADQATRAAWNIPIVGALPVSPSRNRDDMANVKDIIERLGRGRWDGVRLGSRGSGLAGCGGEIPEYYLDDLAESLLESMVPTETALFGGCASIVENLP